MKRIILLIIILIELVTIKIPEYVELNDLAIIEEIGIIKDKNQYTIILKEIIPIKDNQGITYEYEYYEKSSTSIKEAYKSIEKSTKKRLYLKKTKSLLTNVELSEEITNTLDINPKTITHTSKDIIKEIKS